MDTDEFICRECDGDLSDFAKRDAKYASYTQEDFDAEFEKFKATPHNCQTSKNMI